MTPNRFVWLAAAFSLLLQPVDAASQMFPSKADSGRLSAYLFPPVEEAQATPGGWKKVTAPAYGNSAIADVSLEAERGGVAEPAVTRCADLPESAYTVSVLVRGKGKARLAGASGWVEVDAQPANRYQWVELGITPKTTEVVVEVASEAGQVFNYGGVLAEGDVLPVIPVSAVWERIQRGGPVTVALLGDSVTENAFGKGGGSSSFDKGNPGLMKAFLEEASGQKVDYIAHREPPQWGRLPPGKEKIQNPDPAAWPELDALPVVEINGVKVLDARQELDPEAGMHLVNLGKGGAASPYAWTRLPDRIVENDYRFNAKAMAAKGLSGDTLRYGLAHYRPDLVILNFGTNDINGAHPTWTADDFMFYTRCAVTMIQHRPGAAVVVSTPHKWNRGTHLSHHWQPELVDRLRRFCEQSGVALADIYRAYPLGEGDGIHPGDQGHAHMAGAYIHALKGLPPKAASVPVLKASDFVPSGEGVVSVPKTGLMWMRDPRAQGKVNSAEDASALIEKLNQARAFGHADWRLPRREEIYPWVDPMRRPAVVEGLPLQGLEGFFYNDPEDKGWGFNFTVGISHTLGTKGDVKVGFVLPVRDL